MFREKDRLIPPENRRTGLKSYSPFWKYSESNTEAPTENEDLDTTISEDVNIYDAFADRSVDHPMSNFETAIHLMKSSIGTGILAMPQAFSNAGLILGAVGLVLIGIIATYTMHLLLDTAHQLSQRTRTPFLSFAKVGQLSFKHGPPALRPFARTARILISGFVCLAQLGFCCVYFIFVATNLQMLVQEHSGVDWNVQIYLAILLVPLILLTWIRNLKFLAPVMAVGNLGVVTGLGIIFYYIFRDIRPSRQVDANIFPSGFEHFALYFGTVIYAFEGITMILPLEHKMKNPEDFGGWNGMLNSSMVVIVMLNLAVGFFGYLAYGSHAAGSITLNLPQGDWLASSARILFSLSIFSSYALQLYIIVQTAWPHIEKRLPAPAQRITEYIFRTILVLISFLLAEFVPNLSLAIPLVGAFCLTTLGLILPPVFAICTNWAMGYGRLRWKLWKDLILLLFGLICCVVSTCVNLVEMLNNM